VLARILKMRKDFEDLLRYTAASLVVKKTQENIMTFTDLKYMWKYRDSESHYQSIHGRGSSK